MTESAEEEPTNSANTSPRQQEASPKNQDISTKLRQLHKQISSGNTAGQQHLNIQGIANTTEHSGNNKPRTRNRGPHCNNQAAKSQSQ